MESLKDLCLIIPSERELKSEERKESVFFVQVQRYLHQNNREGLEIHLRSGRENRRKNQQQS